MGFRLCQFSPIINQGDAMSGQAIAVHRAAEAAGIECTLFTFSPGNDPSVSTRLSTEYDPRPEDVVLLNYGGRGVFEDRTSRLPGRLFLYYHNVTPPRFFERIGAPGSDALRYGRDSLPELTHMDGLAASEYNKRELLRAGFSDVRVIPYILDFEAFTAAAHTPAASEVMTQYHGSDLVTWLHVGRIAPNKRIEDIIRAFYVYHTRINQKSRLLLVGSEAGFEPYARAIREWVGKLGIRQALAFTGQINSRERVAGFYRLADVYVCMSEHEGFCIPLLEAMIHHVPVVAFRYAGVDYTMGDAGVMIDDKDPGLVAEIVHLLCTDATRREEIIDGQLAQSEVWHPTKALRALNEWFETL